MATDIHGQSRAMTAPPRPLGQAGPLKEPDLRRSRRGVAIMMVVLILAALISIAGPFAISMHIYERSSRHFRDTVRARLAAEGAVAHAISCLRRTEDAAELVGRHGAPWDTPDFDTQEELDVYFNFDGTVAKELKRAGVRFDNPRGVIWSVNVEDEQGKINLISAAPYVLGNMLRSATLVVDAPVGATVLVLDDASLFDKGDDPKTSGGSVCMGLDTVSYARVSGDRLEGVRWNIDPNRRVKRYKAGTLVYDAAAARIADAGTRGHFKTLFELKEFLSPRDFERIQPYVTVNSYRDTSEGWLTRVSIEGNFSALTRSFRVRSVAGFGQGARVRFLVDGKPKGRMNRVFSARQRGQWGYFSLHRPIGFKRQQDPPVIVHVQAEQFHPVNVNTASQPVLTALFAGLGEGRRCVTRLEAERIADYVYYYVRRDENQVENGRPVGSHADFRAMLEQCRKSGWLADGISRTKLDAIIRNATTTICFKAYGNFTIEAAGAVNTRAGEESARHVIRELITMPVDSGGEWSISSQKDFDEQILRLVGPKTETWPFSEPPTSGSALDVYKRGFDPATGRDEKGHVTLATGWAGGSGVAHFDTSGSGWQGAYTRQHGAASLKGGTLTKAGSSVFQKQNDVVKPFTFEGWFRLDGGAAPGLAAGEENRNGFRLSYSSVGESGRPEYLLTVADACADQGNAARPWCGPAEFRFEAPRFNPGDWYHLAMQVKGTSPGEALVWVDGVISRGSPSSYHPGTRLAQSLLLSVVNDTLLVDGDAVYVDDTSNFPDRGTIIVDGEVMEYQTKTQSTFETCRRARRYTHLAAHPTGAVVTPYGYSVPLAQEAYSGRGLIGALGAVGKNPDDNSWVGPETTIIKKAIDETGPDKIYELLGEGETTIEVADTDGFQASGYLRIRGRTRPEGDTTSTDIKTCTEFVFYGKKTTNELQDCVRGRFLVNPNGRRLRPAGKPPREFLRDGRVTVRQISIGVVSDSESGLSRFRAWRTDEGGEGPRSTRDAYACLITEPDRDDALVEWIYIGRKETRGFVTYLLGWWYSNNNTPNDPSDDTWGPIESWSGWRGVCETVYDYKNPTASRVPFSELPVETRIIPVFSMQGPQCGGWDSPRGHDYVTVVAGERAEAKPRRITFAHVAEGAWTDLQGRVHHTFNYRVSFDDTISAEYSSGSGRILKFPSGEFMRKIPSAVKVGGPNGGGFVGAIDELRTSNAGTVGSLVIAPNFTETEPPFTNNEPIWFASDETKLTIMAEMATDGACTPTSGNGRGVTSPSGGRGVVKIGDELIWYDSRSASDKAFTPWGKAQRTDDKHCPYYAWTAHYTDCTRYMQTITLNGCIRGILGTDTLVSDHAAGERVTFFEGIPLTRLREPLPRGGDDLRVWDTLTFPTEGYAIITNLDPDERAAPGRGEIVGWTKSSGTSFEGCEYLKGRYGTSEQDHFAGDFCQVLPFRYWDRWNHDFDNETELAYFQCSFAARDAYWQEIEWRESGYTGGSASDRVRLRIVCRFDGKPDWNERPTNSQGGLWEFTGGGRQYFRSAGGGPLIADSIEVRAYWEYRDGAWDVDANDWKRNVRLDNLIVTFGSPLIVRKVDLLDY